jgi:nucleoside-diphosphate-sugar epimerase
MTIIHATGYTGTIGKHLADRVSHYSINLAKINEELGKFIIEEDSNFLHLAGIVGPSEVVKDVEFSHLVNVVGTQKLGQEFLEKSTGIFYYVSTSHVYEATTQRISEDHPLRPSNIYAQQKYEAELALQKVFIAEPERLCIVRVFSVLDWDMPTFTLGGAIRKLAQGNGEFILRNASDVRDFLTPSTIANALIEIAESGNLNGIVNLCSGHGISVAEAAARMLAESQIQINLNVFTYENSNNPVLVGDNSKLVETHPSLSLIWNPSTIN